MVCLRALGGLGGLLSALVVSGGEEMVDLETTGGEEG